MAVESIEAILKNLSVSHIESFENNVERETFSVGLPLSNKDVEDVVNIIKENVRPENINDIISGIKTLVKSGETLFKTSKINKVMPKLGETRLVPLVYDALLAIFVNTTQIERQHYFHKLLDFYYDNLKLISKNGSSSEPVLTVEEFEDQVAKYIPYVKLEMVKHSNEKEGRTGFLESVSEFIEMLLYPQLLRENCYKIITNKLKTINYEFVKFEIHSIKERLGFLGKYYKLNIFINYQGKDEIIRCFVKCMPSTNETTIAIARASFSKEIFIYNNFIPLLNDLGLEGITNFLPACYLTKQNDYIILEDLSHHQYSPKSIDPPADYDWLVLVINQLAKLHACSFIYEEKMSEKAGKQVRIGEVFRPYLKEYLLSETEVTGSAMLTGVKSTISYFLKKFPEITKEFDIEELKEQFNDAFKQMYKNLGESEKHRNAICHGDNWGSNIMTKCSTDNKPESCLLVDFQMIRYCPPVIELLFLLYINTDKATREKFMRELLDIYYKDLKHILDHYGVNINNIYNYDTFLKTCDYYKLTAICIVCPYIQIMFIPEHIIGPINANPEKAAAYYAGDRTDVLDEAMTSSLFKNKAQEAIEDLCVTLKHIKKQQSILVK